MTSATVELKVSPTSDQIDYAREYLAESGLSSLIVAVNSGEAVIDGGLSAIWVDRDSAFRSFDAGLAGDALFRVYADGHFHLVDEK